jgi:hypothetical protein
LSSRACPTGKTLDAEFCAISHYARLARITKACKRRARKIEFRPPFQSATQCPVPAAKIFRFPSVFQQRIHAPSTPPKGRIAVVTDAELDAVDGSISQASDVDAYGQAVWS